jgi:hypothetical protein
MLEPSDTLAIHALVSLYGHLIDEQQYQRMHELFTVDAIYDISAFGKGVITGHQAIAAFLQGSEAAHPVAHHATNIILAEASASRAVLSSKGLGVLRDGRVASVIYHDEMIKGPEGWRIGKRVALPQISRK